jgi:hypothetical protein
MCKERRRYLFYSKTRKLILSFFLIVFVAFGTIGGCHNDDDGGGGGNGGQPQPTPTPTPTPTPSPTPPPVAEFEPGDIIPGFVLFSMPEGSIADVRTKSTYIPDNARWEVFFERSLTTPDTEGDVQFDFTSSDNLYDFSIAYLDNTGVAGPMTAAAAVMSTQDTAPHSLGNESSAADLKAVMETPSDCDDFTGDALLTTPNDPSVVPVLTIWAAYDDENVYLCVEAPDPNDVKDDLKEHWEFIGPSDSDWDRKSGIKNVMGSISADTDTFDEDRIAIFFDINADLFGTLGCFALCHDERMQSINEDGRADLWHWKATRTDPAGFAEDQRLDPDKAKCPDNPCRKTDTGEGTEEKNQDGDLPASMADSDPGANKKFIFDDEIPADCTADDCDLAVPFAQ